MVVAEPSGGSCTNINSMVGCFGRAVIDHYQPVRCGVVGLGTAYSTEHLHRRFVEKLKTDLCKTRGIS